MWLQKLNFKINILDNPALKKIKIFISLKSGIFFFILIVIFIFSIDLNEIIYLITITKRGFIPHSFLHFIFYPVRLFGIFKLDIVLHKFFFHCPIFVANFKWFFYETKCSLLKEYTSMLHIICLFSDTCILLFHFDQLIFRTFDLRTIVHGALFKEIGF